ncbi:hypothetical protein GCM10010324_44250 [Streptomyces hiroshimensis]|uniref:Uncharacterized protein n=1 Tax=Streptomyces hiroshimensis TaxID=66424 RepID=A0ABQ2YS20_9ACTN|nr:hypothetical protein GCM10010324_44250 [Streptomyces hiroshimensis]
MTKHPEQTGDKTIPLASCLKCTALVVRGVAARRQGPDAVKAIEARRRQHVSEAHR